MGTVPIVIFRGLRQSHSWEHGELGHWDPLISQVLYILDLPEYNTAMYQNTCVLVHLYTNTRVC